jgi:hypothetical protein
MASELRSRSSTEGRPLQFSLRGLLWLTALCSALFAVMMAVGMVASLFLLMVVGLVVAHVLGNAIGTRLRDDALHRRDQSLPRGAVQPSSGAMPAATDSALRQRRPLGLSLTVFVAAGALGGALLGRLLFFYSPWQHGAVPDAVVGIGSCSVLGALAGFMASSFFKVAIWPAVKFFFSRQ